MLILTGFLIEIEKDKAWSPGRIEWKKGGRMFRSRGRGKKGGLE